MSVLAIDPGNEKSGWVLWEYGAPKRFGKHENDRMLSIIDAELAGWYTPRLAIEQIKSYGMSVGESIFETCVWTGRFIQRWLDNTAQAIDEVIRVPRMDVKMHLCHDARAKDGNIRQSIMDRFGSTKAAAIGTKTSPGPLYGVAGDVWAAIGVAITATETRMQPTAA